MFDPVEGLMVEESPMDSSEQSSEVGVEEESIQEELEEPRGSTCDAQLYCAAMVLRSVYQLVRAEGRHQEMRERLVPWRVQASSAQYCDLAAMACEQEEKLLDEVEMLYAVSYTHLTLPTIYSV
eukprot:TRINITY_DN14728_c0_g1_i1.p1 TRINITY_DN14728_c0_g1~~TRINITY_DN14728_c0_g1_i1.p1  ORF type:complete len:124 (+),score=49.21 TRINITY_DN14728_c0_g1_i1:104-475(+)